MQFASNRGLWQRVANDKSSSVKRVFLTAISGSLFASVLVFALLQLANAIILNTFQKCLFAHYLDVHYLAFI